MLEVRPASREDHAQIAAFQVRMARETEDLELDPEVVSRGVRGVFDDPARGSYLVATRDGVVVGCLLTLPEWSDWRCGTVLWIHSVYVVPEARGGGVFRSLYRALRARVEADPALKGLRLYVDRRNAAAAAVYRKLGMDGEHYQLFEWMGPG